MKLMQATKTYDVDLFLWVTRRRSQRILVSGAQRVSYNGDCHLYLIPGLALTLNGKPAELALLACPLAVFAIERPLYFFLKNLCRRNPPQTEPKHPELRHSVRPHLGGVLRGNLAEFFARPSRLSRSPHRCQWTWRESCSASNPPPTRWSARRWESYCLS